MKYLLFTTPDGGYFPSMLNAKTQSINRFRVQLEDFMEQTKKDPDFPPEVIAHMMLLEEQLKPEHEKAVANAPVQRSGVYQWQEAFNRGGDIGQVRHIGNLPPDELEDYDIIHINICGKDATLLPQVKKELRASSTQLICNLDYAVQQWQNGFPTMELLKGFLESIQQADFVFATEPAQQALINHLLHRVMDPPRKKVHVPIIPHPCDVHNIRTLHVAPENRLDRIMICYHRYDKHQYIPWMIAHNIKATRQGVPVKLPVYITGVGGDPVAMSLFSGAFLGADWAHYTYELAHSTIAHEYYSINSHSRFPEECAVLGIPCVGNVNSYSISWIHSLVAHAPLDFMGMRQSIKRLIEDEEFYQQCVEYAWTKVQEIDYEHSKMKLRFRMQDWAQAEGKIR